MSIPSGIILPYNGLNSDSHTGWTRYPGLNGYFIHAAIGDTAGTTGGVGSHTHLQTSHTHSIIIGSASQAYINADGSYTRGLPNTQFHIHGGSTATGASAVDYSNNTPQSFNIIWKQSDGTENVPNGMWSYYDSASLPTNWIQPTGPHLMFLAGAASGADAGTISGATTHTHTEQSHLHSGGNCGMGSPWAPFVDNVSAQAASTSHVHVIWLTGSTPTMQSADSNPSWTKLAIIQNNTGSTDFPDGIIGLWPSTIASIPAGWEQKTFTSGIDFVMCTSGTSDILNTGGGQVHTHVADWHSHATNHSGMTSNTTVGRICAVEECFTTVGYKTHTHSSFNSGSARETINNNSSKTHYPSYKEMVFVKKSFPITYLSRLALLGAG